MKKTIRVLCISCILLIFSFNSCSVKKKTQNDTIMYCIHKNFKSVDFNKQCLVFIIGEQGCINCNRELSNLAKQFVDNDGVYYIINATGNLVDISPYWEAKGQERISMDTLQYLNKNNLKYSYAVFISENKIDTVLEAKAETLLLDKEYIKQKILNTKTK
ncbi:MAG: hypothetical protein J6M30_01035 [Bacteroidales bacterium]|nr:hypothetical protein [Bacteroidales bacterium]